MAKSIIEFLIGSMDEKRAYRRFKKRVNALPKAYRFAFKKIQNYMWNFAGGDGFDMLKTQYDLIELFEAGAAEGRHVLDVTGEDVAGFCDELIRDNKLWTDTIRTRLNKGIQTKLGKVTNRP